jgi:hypothetical protein
VKRLKQTEILKRLREKLDRGFKAFENQWRGMKNDEIINKAREIDSVKTVYEELSGGRYSEKFLEYLLRFENPLTVVRDQWLAELELADIHEELADVLWELEDKRDAEELYELDPAFLPDDIDEGMSEDMEMDMKKG